MKSFILRGEFKFNFGEIQTSRFEYHCLKDIGKSLHIGRIVPIYPLTAGLSQNIIRETIYSVLSEVVDKLPENLPDNILKDNNLINRRSALWNIHFPKSYLLLTEAKRRLKYWEFPPIIYKYCS